MASKILIGAKRGDNGQTYPPENLHMLRIGEDASRDLPPSGMPMADILKNEGILTALEIRPLAWSIARDGQIMPIAVRSDSDGYGIVVEGRRRFIAVSLINEDPSAFKDKDGAPLLDGPIPLRFVHLIGVNDEDALELSLVANLQRLDLDVVDRANSASKAVRVYGWTQKHVAEVMGIDASSVSVLLDVAALPKRAKNLLKSRRMTAAAARRLKGLPNDKINEIAKQIEGGRPANEVMLALVNEKRKNGDMIGRTRAELAKEIAKVDSVRSRWLMRFMAGGDCDLAEILSDDPCELPEPTAQEDEMPPVIHIGDHVVEVHEEAQ